MIRLLVIAFVVAVLGSACSDGSRDVAVPAGIAPADSAFRNGRIYTVDESRPWVEAVAIRDGRFVAVGTDAEIKAFIGDETTVTDLEGRMAMPGIIDLHVHPFATPLFNVINLDFSDPTDPDRMLAELKAFADANPEKKWIRGGSWGVGVFPNHSPDKSVLDEIISDRPVVLIDQTGHSYWLNSMALELTGINVDTPTDEKYVIEKDPVTGDPTGVVRESSLRLVEQAAAQPTAAEYEKAFKAVFGEFNSKGVTSMQTAEGNAAWMDVVQAIDRAGELEMRLFVSWDWHTHQTTPYTDAEMDSQIANRGKYASELIAPNFVKIFTDGAPDGYAVPFLEPYADGSGKYGFGKLTPEELKAAVVAFDAQGVGTFMHSIGDASTRAALDAIEAAREINGDTGVRHKVAHLVMVDPEDIPRFGQIPGVAAEMSPAVTYPHPGFEGYIPYFGEERYQRIFAARSLLNAGARLGYGSDWLTMIPPSPWQPMQGFVTRTNPDAPEKGVLGEGETLTVEQAIRVFTLNGAYAVNADDRIGSIENGKQADMIVLDRNLFDIDPSEIRDTQVLITMMGGQVVFDRASDSLHDVLNENIHEESGRIIH
jgi:predicted amidohydrolase YtcJ